MAVLWWQLYLFAIAFSFGYGHGSSHLGIVKLSQPKMDWWHRVWVVIYCIACAPAVFSYGWIMLIPAFILRVAFFTIAYSIGSKVLTITYIGDGKEFFEGIEVFLFGKNGGVKKMILCTAFLILLNGLNYFIFKLKF